MSYSIDEAIFALQTSDERAKSAASEVKESQDQRSDAYAHLLALLFLSHNVASSQELAETPTVTGVMGKHAIQSRQRLLSLQTV